MSADALVDRFDSLVKHWQVSVDRVLHTSTSLIGFGIRNGAPVVLKLAKFPADEWHAGAVAAAFRGHGVARVLEQIPGAALLEQLSPATLLADVAAAGNDDEATGIIARVILEMCAVTPVVADVAEVASWGVGYERYLASDDRQNDRQLVTTAQRLYHDLCRTQKQKRLLHGDLQHYNVLRDETRGWKAIDPKGIIGELEFEVGAALRNPHSSPDLYSDATFIIERIRLFAELLGLSRVRILRWSYAQAVLSAIWSIEDNERVRPEDPGLLFATAARPLLDHGDL